MNELDSELIAIKAGRDKHDLKGALSELRADWEKHKLEPDSQAALSQKLVAGGLMNDLALEYEKENLQATLSHTDSRSHIRQSAQIAAAGNDTLSATLLGNIENNWGKIARPNSNILSESRIDSLLKESALTLDSQILLQPFAHDQSLFDKLKSDGKGAGLFVDNGNITKESLDAAIQNREGNLTDEERSFAERLKEQFDSPALASLESGNLLTGHKLTRRSIDDFNASNPTLSDEGAPDVRQPANVTASFGIAPRDSLSPNALTSSAPEIEKPTAVPSAPQALTSTTPNPPTATSRDDSGPHPHPAEFPASDVSSVTTPEQAVISRPPEALTPVGALPNQTVQAVPAEIQKPTAEQIKEALTVRNGEGPYQAAARLRALYHLPEDPVKTLAVAHEISKKMNHPHFYSHGQVLEAPADPDPNEALPNNRQSFRAHSKHTLRIHRREHRRE